MVWIELDWGFSNEVGMVVSWVRGLLVYLGQFYFCLLDVGF